MEEKGHILAKLSTEDIEKSSKKRREPKHREQLPQSKRSKQQTVHLIEEIADHESTENTIVIDVDIETDTTTGNSNLTSSSVDAGGAANNNAAPTPSTFQEPSGTLDAGTNTEICSVKTDTKSTKTDADKLTIAGRIENVILRNEIKLLKENIGQSLQVTNKNPMDMNVILQSAKKTKYFIASFPKHFGDLYEFLGDAKFNLTYWNSTNKINSTIRNFSLPIPDQLFITLLRFLRGFNLYTLAHFYDVSEKTIRTIFTTWIMFMFHHFKSLKDVIFPERQVFKKTLPKIFRPFKNIRASIDCTEFKCESPCDYKQQGKSNCTMKCLIAVNPNGAACFVLDLFEGIITDVNIF
ncbi:uncharacterized protein [Clytia hemisphaerica]|uniref:uncharacterized protein n=1 Tax=Clytia hemisphaerica TaxID=252671 RepID=UPI0034D5A5C2